MARRGRKKVEEENFDDVYEFLDEEILSETDMGENDSGGSNDGFRVSSVDLTPPDNLLSSRKVEKVTFIVQSKGYDFRNVETFVEQTRDSLRFFEKLIVHKDADISALEDQIDELLEEKSTLQSTIEIFREQGDPVVDAEGNYILEGSAQSNHVQVLAEKDEKIRQLREEVSVLKDVQRAAQVKVQTLEKDLDDAILDYNELRSWVDENLEIIKRKREESENAQTNNVDDSSVAAYEGRIEELETERASLEEEYGNLTEKYEKVEQEHGVLQNRINELDREIIDLENLVEGLEAELAQSRNNAGSDADTRAGSEEGNGRLAGVLVELNTVKGERDRLIDELEEVKNKNISLSVDIDTLKETISDLERELESRTAIESMELSQGLDDAVRAELEGKISTLESKLVKVSQERDALEAEVEHVKSRESENIDDTNRVLLALEAEKEQREIAERKVREMLKRIASTSKENASWERERDGLRNKVEELELAVETLSEEKEAEVGRWRSKVSKLEEFNAQLEEEKGELQVELDNTQTAVAALEELEKEKRKVERSVTFYKEKFYELKESYDNMVVEQEIAQETSSTLSAVETELDEYKNTVISLRKELRDAVRVKEEELLKVEQLEDELAELKETSEDNLVQLDVLRKKLKEKDKELTAMEERETSMNLWEDEKEHLNKQIDSLKGEVLEVEKRNDKLEREVIKLEQRVEEYTLLIEENDNVLREYEEKLEQSESVLENFKSLMGQLGAETAPSTIQRRTRTPKKVTTPQVDIEEETVNPSEDETLTIDDETLDDTNENENLEREVRKTEGDVKGKKVVRRAVRKTTNKPAPAKEKATDNSHKKLEEAESEEILTLEQDDEGLQVSNSHEISDGEEFEDYTEEKVSGSENENGDGSEDESEGETPFSNDDEEYNDDEEESGEEDYDDENDIPAHLLNAPELSGDADYLKDFM